MLSIKGFQLDAHHLVTQLEDACGLKSWWLFTFKEPIVGGAVNCSRRDEQGELFKMEEINPDKFEWDGRTVRLELESI